MHCCLAEDLALHSAPAAPWETSGGRNPHNTASCRFRPRKTSVITVTWGCLCQGRRGRERSLQEERTLVMKALL